MRLQVRVGDRAWEVEVVSRQVHLDGTRDLCLQIVSGPEPWVGARLEVRRTSRRGEVWTMVRNGRALEVLVRRDGSAIEVSPGNRPIRVAVSSPWAARTAAARDPVEDPSEVRARMPGRVIRVLKREGDPVTSGEGLAVIEAMKMQNELKSGCSGVIARCGITEGQTVVSGDLLFEITEVPVRP